VRSRGVNILTAKSFNDVRLLAFARVPRARRTYIQRAITTRNGYTYMHIQSACVEIHSAGRVLDFRKTKRAFLGNTIRLSNRVLHTHTISTS